MAGDSVVVSPLPPGAGRTLDVIGDEEGGGAGAGKTVLLRGGIGNTVNSRTESNRAPDGTGMTITGNGDTVPGGGPTGLLRMSRWQGSTSWYRLLLGAVAQPAADFAWGVGRYCWEQVCYWGANPPAGADSGMMLTPTDHNRVVTLGEPGVLVYNNVGVLTFKSVGPGGTEVVAINQYAGPLNDLNKIQMVFRLARKTRPASIDIYVNDQLAITRSWVAGHKLPVPLVASGAFYWNTVHATSNNYLLTAQHRFYNLPDIGDLNT